EGQQERRPEVPEVLADRDPDADPELRWRRPDRVAGGEEPSFVELAVRWQEDLPVDVPDLAVLKERRRDEQPMVARLLDERDDRGAATGGLGGQVRQAGVVEPHRDLGGEILEQVSREP